MNKQNKPLTAVLVIIIVGIVSAIIYLHVTPQPGDMYSEFYILNSQGKASDYPDQIQAGQPAYAILGIVNHEGKTNAYRVQIISGGAIIKSIDVGLLENNQKWENKVYFSLSTIGEKQKVEFYLYINDKATPHIKGPLTLHFNVMQTE